MDEQTEVVELTAEELAEVSGGVHPITQKPDPFIIND